VLKDKFMSTELVTMKQEFLNKLEFTQVVKKFSNLSSKFCINL